MATAPGNVIEFGRPMTVTQYMAMRDDGKKYELFEGELVMSPSYFFEHGKIQIHVASKIDLFVSSRKLGKVGIETDVIMPRFDTVLRPDICFISKSNLSIIRGHIYGPPDLAVEVTSPSNWQHDIHFKRLQYERFGVREYWVIDFADGRRHAYQWILNRGKYVGGQLKGAIIRSAVLKGFTLKLGEISKLMK